MTLPASSRVVHYVPGAPGGGAADLSPEARTRSLVRAALWFCLTLAAIELAVRRWTDPVVIGGDDAEYRLRRRWLQAQPRRAVVLLGDSSARRALAPREFSGEFQGESLDALNAGVNGGSGIVAEALAGAVPWRPDHVVFGGIPSQALDSAPFQRHERALLPLTGPEAWRYVTADLVLGRVSLLYERRVPLRSTLFAVVARRSLAPLLPEPTNLVVQPEGYVPLRPAVMPDGDVRRRQAEEVLPQWFADRDRAPVGVRRDYLVRALRAWSGPRTSRTLVLLPTSTEFRATLARYLPHETVVAAWRSAAQGAGAALLDCSAAADDASFGDADHLAAPAAERFSAAVARWLVHRETPPGCALVM